MKVLLTILVCIISTIVGAITAYLLFCPLYLIYMKLSPLPPSEECARGNALAYLSFLVGGLACGILGAMGYARNYGKR